MKKLFLLVAICGLGATLNAQTDTLSQYVDRSSGFTSWGYTGPGELMGNQYVGDPAVMFTEATGMHFDNKFEIEVTEVLVWFWRMDTMNGPDDIKIQVWSVTDTDTPDAMLGQETVTLGIDVDSSGSIDPTTLAGMASIPFPTPVEVDQTDFFVTVNYSDIVDDTIGIVGNEDGDGQFQDRTWQFLNSSLQLNPCDGETPVGGSYYPLRCFWTNDLNIDAMIVPIIEYKSLLGKMEDRSICPGGSAGLSVQVAPIVENYSITWSPSAGLSSTSGTSTTAFPDTTTTYQVVIEDDDGVHGNDTTYVTVYNRGISVDIQPGDKEIGCGETETIVATSEGETSGANYTWNTGTSGAGEDFLGAQPPGTYSVTVENSYDCSDAHEIEITNVNGVVADFGHEKDSLTVFFENESENATSYTWCFDNPDCSTQNTNEHPEHTYSSFDNFVVRLVSEDDDGCEYARYKVVDVDGTSTINVPEVSAWKAVTLYPNPAQHQLYIDYDPQDIRDLQVVIINTAGQQVLSHDVTEGASPVAIDLAELQGGLYFVQLRGEQHTQTYKLSVTK